MISRIVLALEGRGLLRVLKQRLVEAGAMVGVPRTGAGAWERIGRETADLILVSRSRIPPPMNSSIQLLRDLPDPPEIIVLADGDDPEETAQLLAAGCQGVIEHSLSPESIIEVVLSVLEQRRVAVEKLLAHRVGVSQAHVGDFVSNSPVMQAFVAMVERVVGSEVSLLILGETGVGKERLAQAIHNDGPRAGGPFVPMNCGALPETLLESELFGHEQGAYTGAQRARRGAFEMAHGGTLFLDEIGDVPLHLQVKLLRALQEREVKRLGGEKPFHVDVRIIAATNQDLDELIERKLFRPDLYYRLSVMTLTIPPLRQRAADIRDLVHRYIDYFRSRFNARVTGVDEPALQALCQYQWPGNVRELINVVERAMLLAASETITLSDLPSGISASAGVPTTARVLVGDSGGAAREWLPDTWVELPWRDVRTRVLERAEREYLHALLARTRGRVGETAERAGMRPRSLYDKMKEHGLRKEDYRGAGD